MAEHMCRVIIDGETREYAEGTTYQQIAEEYQSRYEHRIVLAFVGKYRLRELRKTVKEDSELRFVTTADAIGHATYKFMMWRGMIRLSVCGCISPWIRDITVPWRAMWS